MSELLFQWDEEKRAANLAKHGLDFRDAGRIMRGPVFDRLSPRGTEVRLVTVGRLADKLVAIVWTRRDGRFASSPSGGHGVKKRQNIVSYTAEELDRLPSETDWAKVDSISEAELEELIRNDPDDVFLTEAELADAVPVYPVDLKKLRLRLKLTQASFAARFGFSLGTLRNWERGRRRPDGPAQILLQVIDREPEAVERALRRRPLELRSAGSGRRSSLSLPHQGGGAAPS